MARTPRLGRGEADSVALAVQLGAQQVVVDDLEAAALAAEARGWYNSGLYVVALATLERVRDTKE